jgi:predicted RNA binding protein YcfA (HicA-like mRNA interferase family)
MRPPVWDQLKSKTVAELIQAPEKDGAQWVDSHGSVRIYKLKSGRKITIHYHPHKTYYDPKLLKGILSIIEWSEQDLRHLKLIK